MKGDNNVVTYVLNRLPKQFSPHEGSKDKSYSFIEHEDVIKYDFYPLSFENLKSKETE
jgi:hypothetical protein